VGESIIKGAGNGVFSRLTTDETTPPTVMCLYPGIYTPDIPPSSYYHDERTTTHYLANQVPPSFQHGRGPDMSSNAYIQIFKDAVATLTAGPSKVNIVAVIIEKKVVDWI
jgi:hypothetical protein